ncbi:type II toxin-antitoxin system RelE/ParE family toxin [Chloroflexota bacterium]
MTTTEHRWEIHQTRQVERVLRRLPKDHLKRIDRAILALAENPRPPGCRKLRGYDSIYRIRVGDWRISYSVEDDRLIVLVIEVAPRGEAHRF